MVGSSVPAHFDSIAAEVAALRSRVQALEEANRALLELVETQRRRLNETGAQAERTASQVKERSGAAAYVSQERSRIEKRLARRGIKRRSVR